MLYALYLLLSQNKVYRSLTQVHIWSHFASNLLARKMAAVAKKHRSSDRSKTSGYHIIFYYWLSGRRRDGDQLPQISKHYASEISWWRFRADPFPDRRTIDGKSPFIELRVTTCTYTGINIARVVGGSHPRMRRSKFAFKLSPTQYFAKNAGIQSWFSDDVSLFSRH